MGPRLLLRTHLDGARSGHHEAIESLLCGVRAGPVVPWSHVIALVPGLAMLSYESGG